MSGEIKNIVVSAEATKVGGTRKRGRRGLSGSNSTAPLQVQTRKVEKIQAGGTSPGTTLQIEANKPIAEGPPKFTDSTDTALAKTTTDSAPASVSSNTQAGGSKPTKQVKVVLEKSKKKPTRVVLQPAKIKKLPGQPMKPVQKNQTRKIAKKIRVSLHGLNKRVTRANTISKDAKHEPLEKVKKTLVDAKLIKAESKAPEDIIRKMYRDYMMLKNRAL